MVVDSIDMADGNVDVVLSASASAIIIGVVAGDDIETAAVLGTGAEIWLKNIQSQIIRNTSSSRFFFSCPRCGKCSHVFRRFSSPRQASLFAAALDYFCVPQCYP